MSAAVRSTRADQVFKFVHVGHAIRIGCESADRQPILDDRALRTNVETARSLEIPIMICPSPVGSEP